MVDGIIRVKEFDKGATPPKFGVAFETTVHPWNDLPLLLFYSEDRLLVFLRGFLQIEETEIASIIHTLHSGKSAGVPASLSELQLEEFKRQSAMPQQVDRGARFPPSSR